MKKVMCVILAAFALVFTLKIIDAVSPIRYESGIVVGWDAETYTVYVEGASGNVWTYRGDEEAMGQKLFLKIDGQNTDTYDDDEVLDIFYKAF